MAKGKKIGVDVVRELNSALFHSLSKHFGKMGKRDDLAAGSSYEIAAKVIGSVDGHHLEFPLEGRLNVNHDTTVNGGEAVKGHAVIAYCLAKMPENTRKKILDTLHEVFNELGPNLGMEEGAVKAVDEMMKRSRHQKSVTRAGSVSFAPSA